MTASEITGDGDPGNATGAAPNGTAPVRTCGVLRSYSR